MLMMNTSNVLINAIRLRIDVTATNTLVINDIHETSTEAFIVIPIVDVWWTFHELSQKVQQSFTKSTKPQLK